MIWPSGSVASWAPPIGDFPDRKGRDPRVNRGTFGFTTENRDSQVVSGATGKAGVVDRIDFNLVKMKNSVTLKKKVEFVSLGLKFKADGFDF